MKRIVSVHRQRVGGCIAYLRIGPERSDLDFACGNGPVRIDLNKPESSQQGSHDLSQPAETEVNGYSQRQPDRDR
jgi:hypothetical protein